MTPTVVPESEMADKWAAAPAIKEPATAAAAKKAKKPVVLHDDVSDEASDID